MDDATLAKLVLKAGGAPLALTPVFTPRVLAYTLILPSDVQHVSCQATSTEADAFIKYPKERQPDAGLPCPKRHPTLPPSALQTWEWAITVDAPDGTTTKTYTVHCSRSSPSDVAIQSVQLLAQDRTVLSTWRDWPEHIDIGTNLPRSTLEPSLLKRLAL